MPKVGLSIPSGTGRQWHAQGGEVSFARPIFQGDVYEGIVMPGVSTDPGLVAIISHPCTFHAGPNLAEFVTVSAISSFDTPKRWDGDFDFVPLENFEGGAGAFAVDLRLVAAIRAAALSDLTVRRVACMSREGVALLNQQQTFFTRTLVSLESFVDMIRPIHEEANLEEEWVELAIEQGRASQGDSKSCGDASIEFQQWLSESGRRSGLKDPLRAPDVSVEFRRELVRLRQARQL